MRKTKHNGTIEITGIKSIEYETLKICPEDLATALEGIVEKRILKREGGAGQMSQRLHSEEWVVQFNATNPLVVFKDGGGGADERTYFATPDEVEKDLLLAALALRSGKIE